MNSRLCILFLVDKSMTYLKNEHRVMRSKLEKQSFTDIPQNRCPWKFHKFHRKIPVLESLFNQVAGLKICNFIKKRLQHRYHEKETTEAVVRRYSSKWVFLKIFTNFTGKYLCWRLFLKNLQAWRRAAFLRRDSNTCVFQWNLRNF